MVKTWTLALPALLTALACGPSNHQILSRQAETPDNLQKVMRGGSRVGCDTSSVYDSLLGIFIDCPEGRMVVSKPTGKNMDAPGDPLQVTCFDGLADPATCRALWEKVLAKGAKACGEGETGPGCGPLKCSGAIDQKSCEDVLESP